MISTHELAARNAKARTLAEWIMATLSVDDADHLNLTADRLEAHIADGDWTEVARSAGVRPPSMETRRAVIANIRARARAIASQPADPFDGLPS